MRQNERFVRAALGLPVDRLPFFPIWGPWERTVDAWHDQGMKHDDDWRTVPGFDNMWVTVPVSCYLCPGFWPDQVLDEDNETRTVLNGHGILMRQLKSDTSVTQCLEYPVKDRASWERIKAEHLDPKDPRRFPPDWDRLVREMRDRDYPLVLGSHPCGFFGSARELMGTEAFLVTAALDPEFIDDINSYLCDLWYAVWNKVLDCVDVDAVMLWEDMAGKQGSLMSPAMFRRFMTPYYKRLISLARDRGVEIAMIDSDGLVEELAPLFAEAGVNLFWPFEAQAGNDLTRIRKSNPRLGMMGGMDKRVLAMEKRDIDTEIVRLKAVTDMGGYVPCPDHMIPPDARWDNWLYFCERWRDLAFGAR